MITLHLALLSWWVFNGVLVLITNQVVSQPTQDRMVAILNASVVSCIAASAGIFFTTLMLEIAEPSTLY